MFSKSKSKPFPFRVPYDYDPSEHHCRPHVEDDSRYTDSVAQHHKDDCDMNVIFERFAKTGLYSRSAKLPQFGDFASAPDFQEAAATVRKATEAFESLPVYVRERFNYKSINLLRFLDDPANLEEARKLGLAMPKECQSQPTADPHSSSDSALVKPHKPTS